MSDQEVVAAVEAAASPQAVVAASSPPSQPPSPPGMLATMTPVVAVKEFDDDEDPSREPMYDQHLIQGVLKNDFADDVSVIFPSQPATVLVLSETVDGTLLR